MESSFKEKIDSFFRILNLNPTKTNKAIFMIVIICLALTVNGLFGYYKESNRILIESLRSDNSRLIIDNMRLSAENKDCNINSERRFDKLLNEYKILLNKNIEIEKRVDK